MALLTFYGLISVLILWRAFTLDKADRARTTATQPPIMQDSEQRTSWDERVKFAVEYASVEVIGWFVIGVIWCLYNLAGSFSTFAGLAAISCGVLILVLAIAWRAFKADTIALDEAA
jgi:hypothetical protein